MTEMRSFSMARKVLVFILGGLLFAGCEMADSSGSNLSTEAEIVSLASPYIVGEPRIDSENRTVSLTVEPMDLSLFDPVFSLSEGAVLTSPASLEDGVPAEFTVTAEKGNTVLWTVTVTVEYGISFTLGGERIVLTGGMMDSGDEETNADLGEGIPGIVKGTENSESAPVLEKTYDQDTNHEEPAWDYCHFVIKGTSTEAVEGSLDYYQYENRQESRFSLSLDIDLFGELGGDCILRFTEAEIVPDVIQVKSETTQSLTEGFAKLKVIKGRMRV